MSDDKAAAKAAGKRELILDAAFRLFEEKGFNRTKIIDIAVEAGIGKGTVYEYFQSKNDIAEAWVEDRFEIHRRSFLALNLKNISAEDTIKRLIERDSELLSGFLKNLEIVSQILKEKVPNPDSGFHKRIKKLVNEEFEMLVDVIDSGIKSGEFVEGNPRAMATAVLGAIGFYITFPARVAHLKLNEENPDGRQDSLGACLGIHTEAPWSNEDLFRLLFHGLKSS